MSNGHTFGVFSKSQKGVTFGNMRASLVEGNSNPNHPDNPASPNRPRVPVRIEGYQNPILGDPGHGQIKRWSAVSLDALEHVIGQMIEQYLRDKSWYSVVRCREALWNMYRRLDWWVNQQTDPMRGDYQRALQMIRDCVYKILKDAEEAGDEHEGVELPHCPAPYQHSYNGTYLNHFDGRTVEVKLFSLPDLGPQTSFPGFFRYMSSTEDQEWTLVHSTGANEAAGSETIMKLSLDTIEFSNSSKLVFRWRFKKMGYIKFKFMASAAAGNGLTFFINNEQVGGEWNRSNTWQEMKFNVSPGQSYKFDWMVRKQTGELFGKNAVYIKDVECYETIRSLDAPTPPDFDTMGGAAFSISGFDWITFSKRSIVRTDFDGIVMGGSNGNKTRTFEVPIGNECDGDISFAYRMDKKTPNPEYEWNLILQDDLLHQYQDSIARRGSKCKVDYDSNWALRGTQADTVANQAKIAYEVVVGPNCTVDVTGAIAIECPVRRIDHYEQTTVKTMENAIWTRSGTPLWQILGTTTDRELRIDNPVQGTSTASTSFTLANDGWFTFSYDQALRPTETFEVLVDGKIVYEAHDQTTGIDVVIPLKAGMHSISFRVVDTRTEQPFTSVMDKDLQYGKHNGSVYTEYGGYGSMLNVSCGFEDIQEGNASTIITGNTLYYTVTLNPGGSFQLTEKARLFATMKDPLDDYTEDTRIFSESFNVRGGTHDPSLVMSSNWTWEDIILRFNPGWDDGKTVQDGVMKVEGKNGSVNTIVKQINMASAGYVQFEYGGDFGSHDRFEFYIDNVLVWQEIRTTYGDEGNRASIPIPAGNHQLKWVYRDNGGTTVTIGGDPVTPPIDNLYGEVCFPQGSAVFPALYPASEAGVTHTTPRTTRYSWSGDNFFTSTTTHAQEVDGSSISRHWWVPEFSTINYTERLTIQPGIKENNVTELKPVKYTLSQVNKYNEGFYSNNNYHTLHVAGVVPDSASGWQTNYFYTDGEVDISFDYLSYLVDSSGRRYGNTSGMYGNSRGQFDVYLVPQDAAGVRDEYKKLQVIDNMGINIKQNFLSITDWSGAGQFKIRETVAAGRYTLVFQMTDKMPDDDYDGKNIYYYTAFRGLTVNVTDSTRGDAAEIDDTKVKVEFIDWDTGAVIDSRVYSKSNTANGYATYDIYYPTPRGGKLYKVQYTLLKGTGTKGGLYGTGGTFSLTNGKFAEYWGEYCKDSNNVYYAKGHSPNPDVGGGGTEGEVIHVPTANSFCWIDAINIYLNNRPPCTGTKMEVFVDDVLTKTINSVAEAPITVNLTNNTTEVKEHTIRYVFTGGCYGDGVTIRGGHFKLTDKLLPAPSYAVVSDFSVTNNKPIWMGGCDGSGIRVKITNEAGTVLLNNVYASQTISTFRVTNLPVSPYSKYMVEVTTTQNGTVSDVTGLPYLTKFKMMDFKAYENYHNVADPFNGKLEFFIDGSLIDSYTAAGGFFTKSYPLPKGDHVLKWVFTELGTGNSWDFCEIDFLQVTKWICDSVTVTPYCEPGMGDKCVEALIRCLIDLWKQRPKACVIGKKTWLFT